MKLCTYSMDKQDRAGLVTDAGTVVDINLAYAGMLQERGEPKPYAMADVVLPADMIGIIESGESGLAALREIEDALAKGADPKGPDGEPAVLPLAGLQLRAPVPNPAKIFSIAINNKQKFYIAERPDCDDHPNYFIKLPTCVTGPYDPIEIPDIGIVGPEIEIAAIIGRRAKNVPEEGAEKYIFGFTVNNDVTAHEMRDTREWIVSKRPEGDKRLTYSGRYKCFDTFAPMGPWLTTADAVPDIDNLKMEARLNGKTVQIGNSSDMVFKWPYLISYLSHAHTLVPGDIVSWGTVISPPDVNFQKIDMRGEGGIIEGEVELLGTLKNPIERV